MSTHLTRTLIDELEVVSPITTPLVLTQSVAGVDALTINLAGAVAAGSALAVNDGATGASVTPLIDIGVAVTAGRTTGHIVSLENLGDLFAGDAINVNLAGASVLHQALVITDAGTGAAVLDLVSIVNTNAARTGDALVLIQNTGDAFIGNLLELALGGASVAQGGIQIADAGTGANTKAIIQVENNNAARTTGGLLRLVTAQTAFTGIGIEVRMQGLSVAQQGMLVWDTGTGVNTANLVCFHNTNASRTGAVLDVYNTANLWSGDLVTLRLDGTGVDQQALVVADIGTGVNVEPLVEIISTNAARTTGALLEIVNAQDAFVGTCVNIGLGGASAAQQGIVVTDDGTGVNTNPLVDVVAANLSATGAGISVDCAAGATRPVLALNGTSIYVDTGVPNDINGADQDLYLRTDGAAGTKIYGKFAGSWAALA